MELKGKALIPGTAHGRILVLDEPLSFWGGYESETGVIIDKRHPQVGECLKDRIVAMPGGRGSSSASSVLAEGIYVGTAPLAIILRDPDEIVVLGGVVAEELYDKTMPVVLLEDAIYERLRGAVHDETFVQIEADGSIILDDA